MPGSNKPFCHTMGTSVTAALGGKSGLTLVHASIWGRCWEEIHDAEAGECHQGWKSYKKRHGQVFRQDFWVSARAGGKEMQGPGVLHTARACPGKSGSKQQSAGRNLGRGRRLAPS